MPEDPSFDSFRGLSAEPELYSTTPPPERIWSVSQVNSVIRKLIEDSVDALWVRGEVGNWRRYPSGHCYFSVKDDRSIAMMPDGSIIASMYLGKEADIVAVDLNDDN